MTIHRWVDQCQSGHDRVRKVPGLSVGQNAASGSSLIGAINAWYNEVRTKLHLQNNASFYLNIVLQNITKS